ncbi:thioesterase II family protein [Actinophytocola oryzae]|uniref:Pyochelin biosynthetic protein PchC n=1 Tax=Actinophytocola oryzae TaxID=502181 RepID=A0A4R7W2I8_9PSEU|nr:alpha/beta fold hydrolase [Actinophytocola oryzae]TDV56099.1 pyochelin biosynthetic protein PchC [Actinophytocola oryzae]
MTGSPADQWVRRFRDGDECTTKLVCFPHAGSVAGQYRSWPRGLPSDVGVMAVRYPGREERFDDPFPPGLEALAEDVADALGELAQRRLVLFGHCFGATVAHEVALRLQHRGYPPAALCVSGTQPPHVLPADRVVPSADEDIIAHVVSLDASRASAFENPDLREATLPAVRGDYGLVGGYSGGPRPLLDCPIHAYAGADDTEVAPEDIGRWAEMTRGAFRLRVLPGGHFYLTPEEATLLADLRDVLDLVRSGTEAA